MAVPMAVDTRACRRRTISSAGVRPALRPRAFLTAIRPIRMCRSRDSISRSQITCRSSITIHTCLQASRGISTCSSNTPTGAIYQRYTPLGQANITNAQYTLGSGERSLKVGNAPATYGDAVGSGEQRSNAVGERADRDGPRASVPTSTRTATRTSNIWAISTPAPGRRPSTSTRRFRPMRRPTGSGTFRTATGPMSIIGRWRISAPPWPLRPA